MRVSFRPATRLLMIAAVLGCLTGLMIGYPVSANNFVLLDSDFVNLHCGTVKKNSADYKTHTFDFYLAKHSTDQGMEVDVVKKVLLVNLTKYSTDGGSAEQLAKNGDGYYEIKGLANDEGKDVTDLFLIVAEIWKGGKVEGLEFISIICDFHRKFDKTTMSTRRYNPKEQGLKNLLSVDQHKPDFSDGKTSEPISYATIVNYERNEIYKRSIYDSGPDTWKITYTLQHPDELHLVTVMNPVPEIAQAFFYPSQGLRKGVKK